MSRGPNRYMSAHSLGLRLRRLRAADDPARQRAKAAFKAGDTRAAVRHLVDSGDVTRAHVEAHDRWLAEQTPATPPHIEDLV